MGFQPASFASVISSSQDLQMIIFSFLFFLLMPAFLARAFLGGGWGGVALVGFLIRVKNAPPVEKNLKRPILD